MSNQQKDKPEASNAESFHFIRQIIADDISKGTHDGKVATRFPPEPNGYLHIGHAKSICLNFGMAAENNGHTNLRFDDTNPTTEEIEYVKSIMEDVSWLGFDWGDNLFYASDYFDKLHEFAIDLIKREKAYVCDLNIDQIKDYRGVPTSPGKDSPYRNRSVEENLQLFEKMGKGEFEDGSHVLRAKIDMSSPNLHMRDPILYRIRKANHYRTKDKWCIYPTYDFTHGLSDYIEGITHSICTLEFEVHRPLYDWILEALELNPRPHQYEFARLNLTYTVLSKRKLLQLVNEQKVNGWSDPRMPTISGLRRRGYTPESIRNFCERIGVAKRENVIEIELLEHCLREHLEEAANRALAVLDPVKVIIDNYPEDKTEYLDARNHPSNDSMGSRQLPFSHEIFIERSDFHEDPPKKYFRLAPGKEVRLRYGYYITCQSFVKDKETGAIKEIHCTYDPETRGGKSPDGRKVKGTIHWVSAKDAVDAKAQLYDHLFTQEFPDNADPENEDSSFLDHLNPDSLVSVDCKVEPSLANAKPGDHYQFERQGYFSLDPVDSKPNAPVFNRTVALRSSWTKIEKKK